MNGDIGPIVTTQRDDGKDNEQEQGRTIWKENEVQKAGVKPFSLGLTSSSSFLLAHILP
jgi:hypothetical protein